MSVQVRPSSGHNITTTSSQVLEPNGSRQLLAIQNLGDAAVYVQFGAEATADDGIEVGAGQTLEFSGPWCPNNAVHLVTESGTQNVRVLEGPTLRGGV